MQLLSIIGMKEQHCGSGAMHATIINLYSIHNATPVHLLPAIVTAVHLVATQFMPIHRHNFHS